jgi:hypothetical protein
VAFADLTGFTAHSLSGDAIAAEVALRLAEQRRTSATMAGSSSCWATVC